MTSHSLLDRILDLTAFKWWPLGYDS